MAVTRAAVTVRGAEHRYGAVLALTLALLGFIIVAPAGNLMRAGAVALEAAALFVAVATSRDRRARRRKRSLAVAVGGGAFVVAVAAGLVPAVVVSLVGGAVALTIPFALVGGLIRLARSRGVNLQVVAGALAIYVLTGLLFAWVIGVAAKLGGQAYFAQGTDGTESTRLYFSFTVLTTTGFGDLSAATSVGRALSVAEMLAGQLYLVTVIGVLVGNLAARRSG
jgi:ion channel